MYDANNILLRTVAVCFHARVSKGQFRPHNRSKLHCFQIMTAIAQPVRFTAPGAVVVGANTPSVSSNVQGAQVKFGCLSLCKQYGLFDGVKGCVVRRLRISSLN